MCLCAGETLFGTVLLFMSHQMVAYGQNIVEETFSGSEINKMYYILHYKLPSNCLNNLKVLSPAYNASKELAFLIPLTELTKLIQAEIKV